MDLHKEPGRQVYMHLLVLLARAGSLAHPRSFTLAEFGVALARVGLWKEVALASTKQRESKKMQGRSAADAVRRRRRD